MNDDLKERVSALLDDEASGSEVSQLYEDDARHTWARYALIGDAMRGGSPLVLDNQLADGVRRSISDEPTVVAFQPKTRSPFWKPVAGLALAASVATMAILGLRSLDSQPGPDLVAQTVEQPSDNRWDVKRPAVEARLNEYLVNHSEYAGYGVQGMLPYARIVSYDSNQ